MILYKKPKLLFQDLTHSGENGQIGLEKLNQSSSYKKLKKDGLLIDGPSSPDSILIKKNLKKYNCFVFIYRSSFNTF